MLTLHENARLCRRELLRVGSLALGGLSLSTLLAARAQAAPIRAESCIHYRHCIPAQSSQHMAGAQCIQSDAIVAAANCYHAARRVRCERNYASGGLPCIPLASGAQVEPLDGYVVDRGD